MVNADRLADLRAHARQAGGDVVSALAFARAQAARFPLPGHGKTSLRWRMLAAVAAGDLTVARVLEPHLDALAILAEAGRAPAEGEWGVFAAEKAGMGLHARPDGDSWHVDGVKPWCSLGSLLSRALVTASAPDGPRLFEVDLTDPSVQAGDPSLWIARGLHAVVSVPLAFADTPATPVGDVGWYLSRPGFTWGGIGVAACWLGSAEALGDTLRAATVGDEPLRDLAIGRVDVALAAGWFALAGAAAMIDAGEASEHEGTDLALRVRAIVADSVETVLSQVAHALGPAPLAFDEEHARRVADLSIYVRQHHGERDLATLGRSVRAPRRTS